MDRRENDPDERAKAPQLRIRTKQKKESLGVTIGGPRGWSTVNYP